MGDWREARYFCAATLRHAHGVAACNRQDGHDGEHSGTCDTCESYDEYATLTWNGDGETAIWPRRQAGSHG